MRGRWLSKRALGLHAVLLVVVPGCLIAGWWQLHVALGGNGLSWAYTFEWPCFAVITAVAWWHLVHEDPEQRALRIRPDLPSAAALAGPAPADPDLETDGQLSGDERLRVMAAARREYQAHLERQSAGDPGR